MDVKCIISFLGLELKFLGGKIYLCTANVGTLSCLEYENRQNYVTHNGKQTKLKKKVRLDIFKGV